MAHPQCPTTDTPAGHGNTTPGVADIADAHSDRGRVPDDDLPERLQHHRWEVGDRIRTIRKARGLTQEDLAHRIDVARNTIQRWEQGQNAISIDQVARLADALGVPTWRLFKDEDPPGAGGPPASPPPTGHPATPAAATPEHPPPHQDAHQPHP
ncbi:MAG TPA: helix-turn-helix transcriptional regulator [Polyangia bacterium]|nr:helix-turn-helix transcriptional regulator [Polyangia bacterium]